MTHFMTQRTDAFFPHPVQVALKEMYKIEREILKNLPNFVDTIVTCLMIFTMIVSFISATAFISVQMYSETIYLVQTSGKLMTSITNSSVYQQMNESLGVGHQAYFKGNSQQVFPVNGPFVPSWSG